MATTQEFSVEQLEEMGLPYDAPEGGEIISDKITGQRRWVTEHTLIFRLRDQPTDEAWRVQYDVGSTEVQESPPWEHETKVTATLVRHVEKLVKVWEEA